MGIEWPLWLAGLWFVILLLVVWEAVWKGIALWKAARNNAIALGLCVLGTNNNGRKLIGLLLRAWVRTRRGIR